MVWVNNQDQFTNAAKSKFANDVDGWLIAYSKVFSNILVTQEVLKQEAKREVPIPNVCKAFNVPYIDTFKLLRSLKIQLG